jgi:hypothetical protein
MRRTLPFAASVGLLAACGPGSKDLAMRQATLSYRYEITADSLPPFANETVYYKVTVLDRKTEQPIQNGEGQIYGQLGPSGRPYTWDSFVYGPEVGTYHAKLRFVIAGDNGAPWQMGMRFRRDSLAPLEVLNWQQQVLPERDVNIKPPS